MLLCRGDVDFSERESPIQCQGCGETHELKTFVSIHELRAISETQAQVFMTLACGKCFLKRFGVQGGIN